MSATNQFIITHWHTIPKAFIRHPDGTLAIDRLQELSDSGINLMMVDDYGTETNCAVLAALEPLGVRGLICDSRIYEAMDHPDRRRSLLKAVVDDYSAYPSLLCYYIEDEPGFSRFEACAAVRDILADLDPAHAAYFNLFPNYATEEMLGRPSYYDYAETFVRMVHPTILSYDHYHFINGDPLPDTPASDDERENQIVRAVYQKIERPGFFDNIEDIKAVSDRTNTPFMVIVLLLEHGPYRNLTEGEIRFEVFQSLCYGARWMSYFTYWTPEESAWHPLNAMINRDGTRNPHYDMVRRINHDLQSIGSILLPHKCRRVFHLGKEPDTKIHYWPGTCETITSLQADKLTAGFFDHNYILLANKDYEHPTSVTCTVSDGCRVTRFAPVSGLWSDAPSENGTYTLRLAPGDATLLRVFR